MKPRGVFGFVFVLLVCTVLLVGCSSAQEYPQVRVPAPSRHDLQTGDDLQLTFTVMKNSVKLKGMQVYLDAPAGQRLTSDNKGYLGNVYFSDEAAAKEREQSTFVLPLKQRVVGTSHLLIVPLDERGATRGGIAIVRARIAAPDNSVFR